MNVGDVVVVLVRHPLGLYTIDYNTEGKCGIVTDICNDGTIGLNDGFLYLESELRPATETEKRAYLTALGVSYVRDLIDLTHWIKE